MDSYHSLFPLEPLLPPNRLQKTSNFSYITSCYKAVNSKDDLPYCLRRIHGAKCDLNQILTSNEILIRIKCMILYVTEHYTLQHVQMFAGFRLVNTKCMMLVDMWKKIQHSNAVTLREVFTTKAFGDHCKDVCEPLFH